VIAQNIKYVIYAGVQIAETQSLIAQEVEKAEKSTNETVQDWSFSYI
jgi:hypothetical protein